MTETPLSASTHSHAPPARAEAAGLAELAPTRGSTRSIALVVLSAGLLAVLTWTVWSWTRSTKDVDGLERFTVATRGFQVLLKEKGELKAAKSTDITCEVEGQSTIINLVDEGAAVEKGDLLVEIASDEIEERIRQEELKEANAIMAFEAAKTELDIQRHKNESDIRKADLEIELKQLELDKYLKGEWEQKLKDAEIGIEEAQIQLKRRAQNFEDSKKLYARNFITRTEFDEDEFTWQKAKWGLQKAVQSKAVLERYTHVADLRRRQSDVEEAHKEIERIKQNAEAEEDKKVRTLQSKTIELEITQDKLAELRIQKENCLITAPGPGFVVYYSESFRWGGGDEIREGAQVRERQILMQLPDTSKMIVVARIHEAKIGKLRIGQSVAVEVEGAPGKQFTGKVSRIAAVADTQSRWLNPDLKEYETEITLDESQEALKPGGTAHLQILVEQVEDVLAIPVQAVFTKGGKRYVFRDRAGGVEHVEVQLGAIGIEWAEVSEGLARGDSVLLAFSEEHTRMIADVPSSERRADGSKRKTHPRGQTGAAQSSESETTEGKPRQEQTVAHGKVESNSSKRSKTP